jgi:hypothetical protein
MFDNLWMLGEEQEEEEEEESGEEGEGEQGQPGISPGGLTQEGAVTSVLAGVSLPSQAVAQAGG